MDINFDVVKDEVFEYLAKNTGWIQEDTIYSFIRERYTHERLFFWVTTALMSLESRDKLVDSSGKFYDKYWRLKP